HTRLVSDWSSDVCSSDLGDAVRSVELPLRAAHAAPLKQEHSGVGEFLDAVIAAVGDEDVPIVIHGNGFRIEELPLPATLAAEFRSEERRAGKASRWRD